MEKRDAITIGDLVERDARFRAHAFRFAGDDLKTDLRGECANSLMHRGIFDFDYVSAMLCAVHAKDHAWFVAFFRGHGNKEGADEIATKLVMLGFGKGFEGKPMYRNTLRSVLVNAGVDPAYHSKAARATQKFRRVAGELQRMELDTARSERAAEEFVLGEAGRGYTTFDWKNPAHLDAESREIVFGKVRAKEGVEFERVLASVRAQGAAYPPLCLRDAQTLVSVLDEEENGWMRGS